MISKTIKSKTIKIEIDNNHGLIKSIYLKLDNEIIEIELK